MTDTFSPKGQFYGPILPSWLLRHKGISLGAKMLYAVMTSCARGGSDHCFPSQAWLADTTGVSIRSAQNYLRELVRAGLIRPRAGRFGSTLKYYFIKAEIIEFRASSVPQVMQNPAPTSANSAEGYANSAHINSVNKNNKDKLPPFPPGDLQARLRVTPPCDREGGGVGSFPGKNRALENADAAFAQVWQLWPVRQAEQPARILWRRLWFAGHLPMMDVLLAKIRELHNLDRWWKRGKAPLLLNWLRDERWNDSPVPVDGFAPPPPAQTSPQTPAQQAPVEQVRRPPTVPFSLADFSRVFDRGRFRSTSDLVSSMTLWLDLQKTGRLPDADALVGKIEEADRDSAWEEPPFHVWLQEQCAVAHA
jgi:hypothetical protein